MHTEPAVIDNRVMLLALDQLYRKAMQGHERAELRSAAREVAATLRVAPAAVAPEGYYADDALLTEYFRLVRALQAVEGRRKHEVAGLAAFQRLDRVMSAPLYGRPQHGDTLFPAGRDALSQALLDCQPDWTIARLTAAALAAARAYDDFSLVGLAARIADPVVLTALRESVVLYAEVMTLAMVQEPDVVWRVDDDLAEQAGRFVEAFNALFHERLPAPLADHAAIYWDAYEGVDIVGRCVRVGTAPSGAPRSNYHWAICPGPEGRLMVRDFWHEDVWTTARYSAALADNDRPDL